MSGRTLARLVVAETRLRLWTEARPFLGRVQLVPDAFVHGARPLVVLPDVARGPQVLLTRYAIPVLYPEVGWAPRGASVDFGAAAGRQYTRCPRIAMGPAIELCLALMARQVWVSLDPADRPVVEPA